MSAGEAMFRRAWEEGAVGMAICSLDGRYLHVNRAYAEMLALPGEELVGRSVGEATHPEDRGAGSAGIQRMLRGEARSHRIEKRYVRPDGRTVWAEVNLTLVAGEDGSEPQIAAQVQDITDRKRDEEAVRASEDRYRTLVEHLPDTMVAIYDREFRNIYIGGSIFDRLGWQPERMRGKTLDEVLEPEIAETWKARFRAAVEGMPNELNYRSESGLDLEVKVLPVRGDDGAVTGVMTVTSDVSAVRRADEALRESQDRLQAILDYAPAVIYLKDAEGRFVLANHGLEDLLGVPFEQIRGRTDQDFFPPELAAELADQDRQVRESQRPLAREIEIVVGGEPRTYFDIKFPIFDSGGEATGVCAIATDITARKRTEVALRVSEQRHRSVVDALEEGVLLHDMSGMVIAANHSAAAMIGLPIDDIVGKYPHELPMRLLDEDGQEFSREERPGHRAFVTGEPQIGVVAALPKPSGELVWLSINCNPIVDPQSGRPFAVAASFADISEQRAAERLKEEFFALVSHELRTPLTSIAGYLELVLDPDEGDLDDLQRHFLGVVERNAKRLQRLVGDLLFVAQFEAGKLALETSPTSVHDVAAEAVESARPKADELEIELSLHAEPVGSVDGDAGRLGQTLDNLISNALKFTPAGGRVDVRVLDRGDRVVIEVEDTGLGIADGEQSRLFERFFRTSTATAQAIPGVGLGLSISKAIVEGHGGAISVASREGHGTTFTIELPGAGPQMTPAPARGRAVA